MVICPINLNAKLFQILYQIKIILICYFFSLTLWLITLAKTQIYFLSSNDFMGSVGKLPIFFWFSLIFVLIGIIYNAKIKLIYREKSYLYLLGIFLLFLILFWTYPLIEPSGRHPVSYSVSGLSKHIVEGFYLSDHFKIPKLGFPYLAYQGFPVLVTIFIELTGIPLMLLVQHYIFIFLLPTILVMFVLFSKILLNTETTFIATFSFITLCIWHLFFVPEFITYILYTLMLFVLYSYFHSVKSSNKVNFVIIYLIILIYVVVTHILVPIIIILFLVLFNIINKLTNRDQATRLVIVSVILFLVYLIYAGVVFFDAMLSTLIESFNTFGEWADSLTVKESSRVFSIERKIATFSAIFPFLISCVISLFIIFKSFLNKEFKKNLFIISCFLAPCSLLIIPYGADQGIARVGFFIIIASSMFMGFAYKKYPNLILSLIIIFALAHPLAYSGGGTKVSVIPESSFMACKFFGEFSEIDSNYFSQSDSSIINFYNPNRAFRQERFTLWYPPIRDFNIDIPIKYFLYSLRDHAGLMYYLDYDPLLEHIVYIDFNYIKLYENGNYRIYRRV